MFATLIQLTQRRLELKDRATSFDLRSHHRKKTEDIKKNVSIVTYHNALVFGQTCQGTVVMMFA